MWVPEVQILSPRPDLPSSHRAPGTRVHHRWWWRVWRPPPEPRDGKADPGDSKDHQHGPVVACQRRRNRRAAAWHFAARSDHHRSHGHRSPDGTGKGRQGPGKAMATVATADNSAGLPEPNYMIWWMQNLPGRDNAIRYAGRQMRNWWDVYGAWDAVMAAGRSLTIPPPDTTPPSVSVAAVRFAAGTTMTGSSLRMTVAWSGTDLGSGIARWEVEQRSDAGAYGPVDLPSPLARSVTRTFAAGHRYRLRVRATDGAGNVSAWAVGPILTPAVLQESTSAIRYTGRWTTAASASASGGHLRWSSQAGATATLTFTGRSIAWVAPRGPSLGKARVYVDGAFVATVSLSSGVSQSRTIVYNKGWSRSSTHVLRLVVASSAGNAPIDVDALLIAR
jgi:hypothetical protein